MVIQNGTSRSLCVALDCFAALFPLTRPAKCSGYAQGLLPIVVRLTNRKEEALHEALQAALAKILPTMTPFLSPTNLQVFESSLLARYNIKIHTRACSCVCMLVLQLME